MRAAVCLSVVVGSSLGASATVQAHGGDPAQALSIVAADTRGPTLVRLNEGLAQLRADGWRYLCPALWGEDAVSPADAVPDGPAVIGTGAGLFVIRDDGGVARHSDALGSGYIALVEAGAAGLFALRSEAQSEVLEVRADTVTVLWSDPRGWADLAVADAFVALMRVEAGRLFELRLTPGGAVASESEAVLSGVASSVFTRLVGKTAYAVLLSSTLAAELGRIEQGSWISLLRGQSIAGPIETAGGRRFVAVDGALARFDGEQLAQLHEPARITCLRQHAGRSYACSDGGLRALEAEGLGASLFTLSELREPEFAQVPQAQRAACELQWQRFRVDLLRAGAGSGPADAGVHEAALDGGAADGGRDAGAGAAAASEVAGKDAAAAFAAAARDAGIAALATEDSAPGEHAPTGDAAAMHATVRDGCQLGRAHAGCGWSLASLTSVAWLWRRYRRRRADRPVRS